MHRLMYSIVLVCLVPVFADSPSGTADKSSITLTRNDGQSLDQFVSQMSQSSHLKLTEKSVIVSSELWASKLVLQETERRDILVGKWLKKLEDAAVTGGGNPATPTTGPVYPKPRRPIVITFGPKPTTIPTTMPDGLGDREMLRRAIDLASRKGLILDDEKSVLLLGIIRFESPEKPEKP